tara:strand:- start:2694 stop:3560 length:867 start_codon:yes stop_codon:yes gene_type:complete
MGTDATTLGAFQQDLDLISVAPETLGTDVVAVAEFEVSAAALNDTANSNATPFLKLVYNAAEHPASDSAAEVTYSFDQTLRNTCFNTLADWSIAASGSAGSFAAVGYRDRLPASMQPSNNNVTTTAGTVGGQAGVLAFHESVLPKRIWSAYGADVINLLDAQSDIQSEIDTLISTCVTNIKSKFAASAANQTNVGYKLWTQAVHQALSSSDLSDRIQAMVSTEGADATASLSSAGGAETITAPFIFANGDELHFDIVFTKNASTEAPDFTGHAESPTLPYRMKLKIVA